MNRPEYNFKDRNTMSLVGEELNSIKMEATTSPKLSNLSTAKLSEIYLKSPKLT